MPPAVRPRRPDRWAGPGTAVLVVAAALTVASTQSRPHRLPTPGGPAGPDPVFAQIEARTLARREVARAVIDGRMGMAEAAARFDWLNRQPPRAAPEPGRDPAGWAWEQAARWVMEQARRDCPDRAAEVAARVRGECESARAAGRPGLPAVREEEGRALLARGTAEAERRAALR